MTGEAPPQVFEIAPLAALAFGVAVGWIVQSVAARLRYNGEWERIPRSRKRAMSAVGAIAAFVAGLWILDHPPPHGSTPFVYRLWLYQTVAAWAGSVLLDTLGRILTSAARGGGQRD